MKAPILISIAILAILSNFCLAQVNQFGNPYYTFYPIESFDLPEQTWHIAEDNRGFIYVGANNGLLEYDGASWQVYETDNKSVVRFVLPHNSGRIYIGGMQTFGYFEPNEKGVLEYNSLMSLLANNSRDYNDVWQVRSIGKFIFFHTIKKIFKYDPDNNVIYVINAENDFQLTGVIDNELYVGIDNIGLCKVVDNKPVLVPGGEFFSDKVIFNILPFDSVNILISGHHSLYVFNMKEGCINLNATNEIKKNFKITNERLYYIFLNKDQHYVINTINNGTYIIDKEGNLKKHFSTLNTLPSDVVFSGYESENGNLWLSLDIGILKIENMLPLYKVKISENKSIKVLSIIKHRGIIYFATSIGLYFLKLNKNGDIISDLNRFENINTTCTDFNYFIAKDNKDTLLLLSSEDGAFIINGLDAKPLTNKMVVSTLYQCKINPDIILLGTNRGLAYIKYQENKLSHISYFNEISGSIGKIIEDMDGNFWLGTYNNGFYVLKYENDDFRLQSFYEYSGINKNNSEFAFLNQNEVFYTCTNGIYSYNFTDNEIRSLNNLLPNEIKDKSSYILKSYNDSIFWVSYYHNQSSISAQLINGTFPQSNFLFKRLIGEGIFSIFQESDQRVWFGSKNGIIYAENFDKITYDQKPKLLFRQILNEKNNIIYGGSGISKIDQIINDSNHVIIKDGILYENNNLEIKVSSPSMFADNNMQYSFYLEGFDSEWDLWSNQNYRSYKDLAEGKYILHIKSRNIIDVESTPIILEFRILPPWNRTILAIIIKLLILVLLILLLIRFFIKRFEREKQKLEKIITERSSKIIDQKAEIESQARLLDQKNKSLTQLSIVAQKTDNPVIIANPKGEVEWVNDSFYKFFKLPQKDLTKATLSEICINSGINEKVDVCLLEKKPLSYCVRFDSNIIKDIYFQTTITPVFDKDNNVTNLILVCSDITNIIELNKTRDIIISVITHDLKSPLLGFRMMSKTLSEYIGKYSTEQIREKIKVMEKHSSTIYDLLEDLTEWFKSQRGILSFNPTYLELRSIVDNLIELYKEQIIDKPITIENNIPDRLSVFADEHMVRTIFRNLLSNSVKYTEKGLIEITAENKIKMIEISVSDQGSGFSDEVKSKIFNYQNHEGLGLMICKEFVIKNGGTIWIADNEQGAKVLFTLPSGRLT